MRVLFAFVLRQSVSCPNAFGFYIWDDKEHSTDRLSKYYASLDPAVIDNSNGDNYIALIPKPYATLEEVAENLTDQIIEILQGYEALD